METPSIKVFEVFKQITMKLKKRNFFRKANFSEAIGTYSELLKILRRSEDEEYSALTCVAIAKCQRQEKNYLMEALYYHRAGKYFLTAQKQVSSLKCPTYQELAELGIECYLTSISVYMEQKRFIMASSLYYELANLLMSIDRTLEASQYFEKAADLQQNGNVMSAIISLKCGFECDIKNKKYDHAEKILQWIGKLATEQSILNDDTFYIDIKIESCISNILLLILQKDLFQARLMNRHLVYEYQNSNVNASSNSNLSLSKPSNSFNKFPVNTYHSSSWLFSMIDALIDAVESFSENEILQIQCELEDILTPCQNQLIQGPIVEISRILYL